MREKIATSPPANAEAGFTLIELIVALVLVGFLTAVIYPSFAALQNRSIDDAASSLVSLLRNSRHEALTSGKAVEVDLTAVRQIIPASLTIEGLEDGPIILLPTGSASGGKLLLRNHDDQRVIEVDWITGSIGITDG